jgi:O-antigen ligase
MQFSKNVGSADKIARLGVGALLVVLALTGTIGLWGWLGLIFIGTAFLNFCPIYRIFGMKTCQDC